MLVNILDDDYKFVADSHLTVNITDSEQDMIRAWLTRIGEDDQKIVDDVLVRCRTDEEARIYFLKRARFG